jgi:hypothetical protein
VTSLASPPRFFLLAQILVCLGVGIAGFTLPAASPLLSWIGPVLLITLGSQWAFWPSSNPAFHPFGVRIMGVLMLALALFILLKFVTE